MLVATDTHTVQALNTRAHDDRVATGQVLGPTIVLGSTSTGGQRGRAGVGDLVLTRRNDRTLTYDVGHVRNGTLLMVTCVHADGALDFAAPPRRSTPTGDLAPVSVTVTVPAEYVADHVDLGYACTVHRAQGLTVDTSHP